MFLLCFEVLQIFISTVFLTRCLSTTNSQASAVPNIRIWTDSDQIGSLEYTPVRLENNPTTNKTVNSEYGKPLILTLLINIPMFENTSYGIRLLLFYNHPSNNANDDRDGFSKQNDPSLYRQI